MYKILGSDGNEYDSISAEKIRQWIQESRVEPKTPVMPEGAADWVFLSDLPEFATCFAARQKKGLKNPAQSRRRWLAILLVVVAATVALVILKKAKYP